MCRSRRFQDSPVPRQPRCGRVDLVEVSENPADRSRQAVNVQPAEFHPPVGRPVLIFSAQPVHEFEHLFVAPHPAGKTCERLPLAIGCAGMPYVPVNPGRIRPIRFDSDNIEAMVLDQMP